MLSGMGGLRPSQRGTECETIRSGIECAGIVSALDVAMQIIRSVAVVVLALPVLALTLLMSGCGAMISGLRFVLSTKKAPTAKAGASLASR